jgi:feruloyl esterase
MTGASGHAGPAMPARPGQAASARAAAPNPSSPSAPVIACAALAALDAKQPAAGLPDPTTVITAARTQAAAPASGQAPATPEHCEVTGRINERIGFNSQHYAINFRMRLPAAWNGRFFFQGGGGTNGNLGDAIGNLQGALPTTTMSSTTIRR